VKLILQLSIGQSTLIAALCIVIHYPRGGTSGKEEKNEGGSCSAFHLCISLEGVEEWLNVRAFSDNDQEFINQYSLRRNSLHPALLEICCIDVHAQYQAMAKLLRSGKHTDIVSCKQVRSALITIIASAYAGGGTRCSSLAMSNDVAVGGRIPGCDVGSLQDSRVDSLHTLPFTLNDPFTPHDSWFADFWFLDFGLRFRFLGRRFLGRYPRLGYGRTFGPEREVEGFSISITNLGMSTPNDAAVGVFMPGCEVGAFEDSHVSPQDLAHHPLKNLPSLLSLFSLLSFLTEFYPIPGWRRRCKLVISTECYRGRRLHSGL